MNPKLVTKGQVAAAEQQPDKPVALRLLRESLTNLQPTDLRTVQGGNSQGTIFIPFL